MTPYEDDDLLGDPVEEEKQEEEEPTAVDLLLEKLDKISDKLGKDKDDEEPQQQQGIQIPDVEPDDPTYGFDPEKIVEGATERAKATFVALNIVQKDLKERFGEDLPEEELDQIVATLASLPFNTLKETVSKQGHVLMAYAKVGEAYKSGKVQPKRKVGPKPMPSQSGSAVEGNDPLVEYFESIFGPVRSKKQLQRLLSESRGVRFQ